MTEFLKVKKIKYNANSRDALTFKHYNKNEKIFGKKMSEHLRFSVCYWHTWRGNGLDIFGEATKDWTWEKKKKNETDMDVAKRRVKIHFEFLEKLGVEYFTFHDRDIAPEGKTIKETNENLDEIIKIIKEMQKKTGIKLLWGTCNLFSHKRYMNGAMSNPDPKVVAFAAQQVKKGLEITKELGGENFVFWGGREGYQSLLNTNYKKEMDHIAGFLKMAVNYKKRIGFKGTLLIEPKPREPMKHQYDFDSATTIAFLKHYGLGNGEFKINIENNHATLAGKTMNHEVQTALNYNLFGSIDANTGDCLLGWDTDQFNLDIGETTKIMRTLLNHGGFKTGGLNFDAKLRRESTDPEDLFIAHISSMDAWAKGLKIAVDIINDGLLRKMVKDRYIGFETTEIGKKIESGDCSFEELEKLIKKDEILESKSAKQEKFESIFSSYL